MGLFKAGAPRLAIAFDRLLVKILRQIKGWIDEHKAAGKSQQRGCIGRINLHGNARHEKQIGITKELERSLVLIVLYCSSLFFIHEKANSIAIHVFWTGRPHSLGSCHFPSVWATCLPCKGGGVPLSALPKDTTRELGDLFSTIPLNAERQAGKLWISFLKVFWYDSTRGVNPRSTGCEADANH